MYMDALASLGVGAAHPGGLQLTKDLVKHETFDSNTHVLDIGCGTGLTSFYLYNKFQCQVEACDTHPLMLEKANKRFEHAGIPVRAVFGEAEALPFTNESFDYIISESVTAFTDIKKSINEYARVLKPGGKLLAIEMTHDGTLESEHLKKIKNFYQFNRILTAEEWKSELSDGYFSEVMVKRYQVDRILQESANDFHPSDSITAETYEILLEHDDLATSYYAHMFPCVIYGEKGGGKGQV
jgi:ubiquinone/menaquinone biosynthesis C-methylase UbiE